LRDFRGPERYVRILFDIEEVLASQFSVLEAASGVYAICLNFDFQYARRYIPRLKVRVASHLLKFPLIAADDSTSNLIELSTGVIS